MDIDGGDWLASDMPGRDAGSGNQTFFLVQDYKCIHFRIVILLVDESDVSSIYSSRTGQYIFAEFYVK